MLWPGFRSVVYVTKGGELGHMYNKLTKVKQGKVHVSAVQVAVQMCVHAPTVNESDLW